MNQTNFLHADKVDEQLQRNAEKLEEWAKKQSARRNRLNEIEQRNDELRKLVNRAITKAGITEED